MEFEGRRRLSVTVNLVPLINIVFLLLIFFMLTSTLTTPDAFDVTLPESTQGQDGQTDPIVVLIAGDGALALDNVPLALADLEPALAAAHEARPEASVLVKADARATTADVASVLRRARAAGIDKVGLATASPSS